MPKRLTGKKRTERDALIRKWYKAGVIGAEIQERVKQKYGIGIHSNTLRTIREDLGIPPTPKNAPKKRRKPKPKPEDTALVLASPSGLVPAKELTPRLRALITHVADAMIEEGVLAVAIDGREVMITHVPEETVFEV